MMSLWRSPLYTVAALVTLGLIFAACAGPQSFLAGAAAKAQPVTFEWRHQVYKLAGSPQTTTLTVSCPQGERVVGGGFRLTGKDPQLEFLRGSLPTADLAGWQVVVNKAGDYTSQKVVVYASCATAP